MATSSPSLPDDSRAARAALATRLPAMVLAGILRAFRACLRAGASFCLICTYQIKHSVMSNTPSPTDKEVVRAPHAPLTEYYEDEAARPGFLRDIFDKTASDYDRVERLLCFGSGSWYRRQALIRAGLKPGMRILDVAVGTGLVAREAVVVTGDAALVTGIDPSVGMMNQANLPGVKLIEGRAESLPFPDASVDFLSMGYALRHMSDLSAVFTEFRRVLKPGGRLCILEITRPEGRVRNIGLKFYMRKIVPLLARCIGASPETDLLWRYYWDTIENCVPYETVMAALEAAGFEQVDRFVEMKALGIFSEYQALRP